MNHLVLKLALLLWHPRRGMFYRDLADAFVRKVSMRDFLERHASNCRLLNDSVGNVVMRALIARHASGNGGTLHDLMAGIVPRSDLMLLSAIDDSGTDKAVALMSAAEAVDFQMRSLKTLALNLLTPALAMPIVGVLCIITSQIIGSIAESAPPGVWVGFNGLVRVLAEFITGHWGKITLSLLAAIAMLVYSMPRWTGLVRLRAEKLPGYSLYRDYNAAIVLTALAMMLANGKTLGQALDALRVSASPWLRWHLQRIINALEDNPTDYQSAFGRGLMPLSVRARLASLLDSAKSFDVALVSLGTREVDRLETSVRLSAQTVNWTLTGFLVTLAVVLSVGQMTIASALAREADPARLMLQNKP